MSTPEPAAVPDHPTTAGFDTPGPAVPAPPPTDPIPAILRATAAALAAGPSRRPVSARELFTTLIGATIAAPQPAADGQADRIYDLIGEVVDEDPLVWLGDTGRVRPGVVQVLEETAERAERP